MRTLAEAAVEAAACTRCRLADGRTQVVYGVGNPAADLMFIGEGPGFHEDQQGEPFVGAAGRLLTRMLGGIGLRREDVYIANVIKCLRYSASVQLGDGSWERIGRLVRDRYEGTVMSMAPDGSLVPKRVIGWHRTPLGGRRVLRMTHRSAKLAGRSQVAIELTADHPVLTERGYVPAGELVESDRIATGQGLSDAAFDVVAGTVLGDGHLNGKSSHLSFTHSQRQAGYARFKAELLAELRPVTSEIEVAAIVGGAKRYPVVMTRTRAHRALRILRWDFYRDGRKRVPGWIVDRLGPRMLAIWFMDDGHLRERPGRRPSCEIAVHGFSDRDAPLLLRALEALGLQAKFQQGRIQFGVDATQRLSEMIAPFVPPSMRYKLTPAARVSVSFDPAGWMVGPPKSMYDRVEIEDVTDRARTDTAFFCIDVEDTNNFVTTAGVVHNCRPPGNRDPLPDEIEACTPWLVEQISLIQPRLIVTLGNFATRFVLSTSTGISRLRGQTFSWHGRTVIPTFHPAAILRGGGEGTRQFEQLRSDFVTIRQALDDLERRAKEVADGASAPAAEPIALGGDEQLELF
jgi:uracil-DNA glycosylase family 4